MKKIRQICMFALMLGLMTVLFVALGTSASAATYGDLTYKVSNGNVTITDCNTSATEVDIPSEIDGYPVVGIANFAFQNCGSLESVTVPDSVTYIGNNAFATCVGLKSINIPNGVASVGDSTFRNCGLLGNVTIPDSVTSIGAYAFSGCSSFTDITIPSSVTSIDRYAFENCSSLEKITINNPDCDIYISVSTISSGTTIYGHCNSTARAYAKTYSRDFKSLENVAVVTIPTCTEKGFTTYTCSVCGDSYVDDYVDATGHSFNRVVVIKSYTCTKDGFVRIECSKCGITDRELEVIAPGHDYVETEVNGETHLVCSVCGDGNPDNIVIPDDSENEPAIDSENDTTVDSKDDNCSCNCHSNNALLKFIYKIYQFFWKLFGMTDKKLCACGAEHW